MRLITMFFMTVFIATLVGCNDASNTASLTTYPVSGKVLYEGKPIEGVEVALMPIDAPMVPAIPQNPYATTKADGTFTIGTFAEGDGAAEGEYIIVLRWNPPKTLNPDEEESEEEDSPDRFFGWYDPMHSKLRVRVKSELNEIPVIKIPKIKGPPRPARGIPGRN